MHTATQSSDKLHFEGRYWREAPDWAWQEIKEGRPGQKSQKFTFAKRSCSNRRYIFLRATSSQEGAVEGGSICH